MKHLIVVAVFIAFAAGVRADIQDPPANDYGATRKLGRGLSNFFLAPAEIPSTIAKVNTDEGNAAAAGYGVVRGLGRSAERHIAGIAEIFLWFLPTYRDSYYPVLPLDVRYIHEGYSEFPPELGNESRYDYVRDY